MTGRARTGLGARWHARLISAVVLAAGGCRPGSIEQPRVEPAYDERSGRLVELRYDADGDGRAEIVSYMDGSRIERVEVDVDRDGRVDRWEHYDPSARLERVGISSRRDGKADTWSVASGDSPQTRLELSTTHDGFIDRREVHDAAGIVHAEDDTDRDGRADKWERFRKGRLAEVAFDTDDDGHPDHRLVYDENGSVRVDFTVAARR